jgi:hypothetical protein
MLQEVQAKMIAALVSMWTDLNDFVQWDDETIAWGKGRAEMEWGNTIAAVLGAATDAPTPAHSFAPLKRSWSPRTQTDVENTMSS